MTPLLLVKEHLPVLALICKEYGYKFYTLEGLKKAQIIFDKRAEA